MEKTYDSDEDEELKRRLTERWAYDVDDEPVAGPDGHDESSRKLVDDYSVS